MLLKGEPAGAEHHAINARFAGAACTADIHALDTQLCRMEDAVLAFALDANLQIMKSIHHTIKQAVN